METEFVDKILLCVDCGEEFVFTASAQQYFAERGFREDPRRCKHCYMRLKRARREKEREQAPARKHERREGRVSRAAARSRNGFNNGYPRISEDYS